MQGRSAAIVDLVRGSSCAIANSRRELPASTGVIDVASFLGALKEIGFTGPVRVEPFNEAVRRMPPEQAIAAAKAALDKAFATVA